MYIALFAVCAIPVVSGVIDIAPMHLFLFPNKRDRWLNWHSTSQASAGVFILRSQ